MGSSRASDDDRRFRDDFEAGQIAPGEFGHRAHLRLAYVYVVELDDEGAYRAMRDALHGVLARNGIDPAKYHETLTRAWILAVRHFLAKSPEVRSTDELLARHPEMLDAKIMNTHYSTGLLFSPAARAGFVEPDLDPIPRYDRTDRR